MERVEDAGGRRETGSAEGGIRRTLFLGVLGCPPCGFSSGFAFVDVRGCSLMVVGVPVKIPVIVGNAREEYYT